jgi:hypothetical protein
LPDPKPIFGISPYAVFNGNPILNNDPLGDTPNPSTDVTENKNGTYTVVGGKADGDRNIYIVNNSKEKKRTGKVIGKSLTEYSFLDDNGNAVQGAVINPKDQSGTSFLNNEIIGGDLSLAGYMANATGGKTYDFKTRGIKERPKGMSPDQFAYRGMPFEDVKHFGNQNGKTTTFASARDFGNVAAGFMAGNNGLPWKMARLGFDALESYQHGGFSSEGQPTQRAERLGHGIGIRLYTDREVERIKRSATNPLGPKW